MYIPGWLLFLGVVVAIYASKRLREAVGGALAALFLFGFWLLVLAGVVFVIWYVFSDTSRTLTVLLGAFLGAVVICLELGIRRLVAAAKPIRDKNGRFRVGAFRRMLRRHERRVARLKDPRAVVAEGQSFAQAIALGEALLYFYMTIDNFPLWYAETDDEASWSSKTIPRGLIGYCDLRDLTRFDLVVSENAESERCLTFKFRVGDKWHAFCAFFDEVPEGLEEGNGWTLTGLRVFIVALPSTVVLEALLVFDATFDSEDDVERFVFRRDYIDSLRPGDWLTELLSIADRVTDEVREQREAADHEEWKDLARKFA